MQVGYTCIGSATLSCKLDKTLGSYSMKESILLLKTCNGKHSCTLSPVALTSPACAYDPVQNGLQNTLCYVLHMERYLPLTPKWQH